MRVSIAPLALDDITALDAQTWNRLAEDCAAARHEFVSAMDTGSARTHRYFVVADGAAYQCAARLTFPADYGRTLAYSLYGRGAAALGRLGLRIGDVALCGWPLGRGRNVLVDPKLREGAQRELLHGMCAAVEAAAAGTTIAFPDILPNDVLLARVLTERGYCVAGSLPTALLDVQWQNLDGYLAALRRTSKNWSATARTEINRYQKSGAAQLPGPDIGEWDTIAALLNRHHERLNNHSPGHTAARLRRLKERLGDDLIIFLSRQSGAITGVSVAAQHGADATLSWIGVDHAATGNNFTYFNLAYYAPAAALAQRGVRRLWLGNAAYEAKIRRGCRVMPSDTYLRFPTRVSRATHGLVLPLQRAWYRRKFRRFLE